MKLSVIEWAVLALTGLFLTFTVGYFTGTQRSGTVMTSGTITVQTETTPSAAQTAETESTTEAAAESSDVVTQTPEATTAAEEPEQTETEDRSAETENLVNINTASAAELEALPGIGEELASRIVAYREDNGPFQFAEDITNVYGIGDGKYASIADYITVGD